MDIFNEKSFLLQKTYMDCVDKFGNTFIGYAALVHWKYITINYSHVLIYNQQLQKTDEYSSFLKVQIPEVENSILLWNNKILDTIGSWQSIDKEIIHELFQKENKNVLGAETEKIIPEVKEIKTIENKIEPIKKFNSFQKAFASPRNTTNIILYIFFGIIAISLLLYLFIKMKNYHLGLITNGLIVLAIIGAVFVANYYLSHRNMVVTQNFDYSNENK